MTSRESTRQPERCNHQHPASRQHDKEEPLRAAVVLDCLMHRFDVVRAVRLLGHVAVPRRMAEMQNEG